MPEVSFGRRIAALLIDWTICALSAVAVFRIGFPPASLDEDPSESLILTGLFFVYTTMLVGLVGGTIGKRIMRLRVENPAGTPIGVPRAALRTALLCAVLPAIVQTDDKRGLHDLAAGSRVTTL